MGIRKNLSNHKDSETMCNRLHLCALESPYLDIFKDKLNRLLASMVLILSQKKILGEFLTPSRPVFNIFHFILIFSSSGYVSFIKMIELQSLCFILFATILFRELLPNPLQKRLI